GGECTRHEFDERRFAFAVRADKSQALAFRKGETHIFEYAFVIVAEAYVFESNQHNLFRFPQNSGMKKIKREDIEALEAQLLAASPAEVAPLVKKLVKLKRDFLRQ